ncbi:MAG TPA: B-4DMT family transporter [Pseudonocardiaceae bacterium]|jgi:predicted outer membrane lipoprotein|nr:B-4DMT family transporter [Pseudonocardiaceae bacterium]
MRAWVSRGIWMGVLHGAVQTGVAAVNVRNAEAGSAVRPVALGLLIAAAMIWGVVDGWRELEGRGMNWFFASLVGGPLAGVIGVIGAGLLVDQTGVESLGAALTGGAAFTALLVLVPAALGLVVGTALPEPGAQRRKAVKSEPRS